MLANCIIGANHASALGLLAIENASVRGRPLTLPDSHEDAAIAASASP